MTKILLWQEYQQDAGENAYGYSQFCNLYNDWLKLQKRSMRQHHVAGEKLFLDFCGPTIPVINPDTGEVRQAQIFVATLGASNYTYVEACENQRQESWLMAHVRAFEFFGGVPQLLVPDIWSGSQSFSETRSKYANFSLSNAGDLGRNLLLDISLIKTGPIASGSVVNASSFPHLTWDIATGGVNIGYAGLPIHLIDIAFTGSINFVTQTCTPQNVTVNMGLVGNSFFKGKGATAGTWRDASVQMTGCPTFSGYYGKSNPQSSDGSGTASGGTRVANLFTLSVTPAHGLVDSANSIMALESGTDAATGLGLQLIYGKVVNASVSDMYNAMNMWKSGSSWDVPTPTDGRTSFKLPLAVNYYQTADRVTPGKANTQFTVNIDYK